eukprot:jgi/Tetstr1/448497/TSEL_035763.t1
MASVSTFHAAAGTDDASWEDIMLPRGAREPPPVPRGPPPRYYLTTAGADDSMSYVEIPRHTNGHIIKRFEELATTGTGFAYDIIPDAPTDNVMRKQIHKGHPQP